MDVLESPGGELAAMGETVMHQVKVAHQMGEQ